MHFFKRIEYTYQLWCYVYDKGVTVIKPIFLSLICNQCIGVCFVVTLLDTTKQEALNWVTYSTSRGVSDLDLWPISIGLLSSAMWLPLCSSIICRQQRTRLATQTKPHPPTDLILLNEL